jgi:outer membrane protein
MKIGYSGGHLAVRICVACLIVFLQTVVPAGAQDLLYYYAKALKNDPQFRGSQYDHLASREILRQAYAGLLPQIVADVSYTLSYQDIWSAENSVYAVGTTDYDTQSYGVTLTQPLFRYTSFLAVNQAKSSLKRADLELEKERQDLILRVVEAYVNLLAMEDKLTAVIAEEAALASHSELAAARSDKGLAPITDRYDTAARLAAVSAQKVEMEYAIKDGKQALSEICNEPVQDTRKLKDEIPLALPFPQNVESWIEASLQQNLEILIQKQRVEIADTEIQRQKAAHYPNIDFQADYVMKDTSGSLFGGGSQTSTYNLMFKLSLPLYEGGLRTSKSREAVNLHASSTEAALKLARSTERKARSTYNAVLSASNRVSAMKKSVEAQQLVVSAKEEGFRSGMLIGLAVLDAAQDLYKYKREYSQARNDYILNMIKLKHTAGTLGEDDVKQVNALLQ